MNQRTDNESLLTFPSRFPIKVMGKNQPGFETTVVTLVQRHAPAFDAATVEARLSKGDRYLSLTIIVHAESRAQLDAIYRELTACEDVVMVL